MARNRLTPEIVFQHAQLLADCAMGDMRLIGGLAHAAQPRHCLKARSAASGGRQFMLEILTRNSQNKSILWGLSG